MWRRRRLFAALTGCVVATSMGPQVARAAPGEVAEHDTLLPSTTPDEIVDTAPPSYDRYASELERAQLAVDSKDLAVAIDAYTSAYDALPEADRGAELGEDVVERVTGLTQQAFFKETRDSAPLRRAAALVQRHIDDAANLDPGRDTSTHQTSLDQLEWLLGLIDKANAADAAKAAEADTDGASDEGASGEEPESRVSPKRTPEHDTRPAPRRGLFLGLTIGGGALAAAGIGLLAYGGWFRGRTRRFAEQTQADVDAGVLDDPADLDAAARHIDQEDREAGAWLGAGAVALTAGVGLLAGGLVVYMKDRNAGRSAARVGPMLGARRVGLTASWRF